MIQTPEWWLFLALGPVVYWLLPQGWRAGALAAASLGLLARFMGIDLAVMGGIALIVHLGTRPGVTGWLARTAWPVWLVLLYLVWSKYLPGLARAFTGEGGFADWAVPLGVSYFAFKLIHYAIETRRGTLPAHGVADYLCWLFLAPIFTAGPIERFEHFRREAEVVRFEGRFLAEGLLRIAQGLVKKFLIGLVVLEVLEKATGGGLLRLLNGPADPAAVWAGLALTLIYVYLDFSAYSDIAIGSARLFGYRIMENFNLPFLAKSLQEFWQRWHMTLAHWCRSYIYMSMIGLTRNPYHAVIATFLVMGLWHSASPNWIAWGAWHGAGLAWLLWWGRFAPKRGLALGRTLAGSVAARGLTLGYVTLGGGLTALHGRAPFGDSLRLMARAFGISI